MSQQNLSEKDFVITRTNKRLNNNIGLIILMNFANSVYLIDIFFAVIHGKKDIHPIIEHISLQ